MHKNGQQWLRMCQVENATVMNANALLPNAAKWFTMRSECLGHKSHAFGAQITHIPNLEGYQDRSLVDIVIFCGARGLLGIAP